MQSTDIFVTVCLIIMAPFLGYLIFQLIVFLKSKKPFFTRAKKEEYVFYEVDEKGNLMKLD